MLKVECKNYEKNSKERMIVKTISLDGRKRRGEEGR
jgi:hypothetical protein